MCVSAVNELPAVSMSDVLCVCLQSMNSLLYLDVSWNSLSNTRDEMAVLRKYMPVLSVLDIRHNYWQKVTKYPHTRHNLTSNYIACDMMSKYNTSDA